MSHQTIRPGLRAATAAGPVEPPPERIPNPGPAPWPNPPQVPPSGPAALPTAGPVREAWDPDHEAWEDAHSPDSGARIIARDPDRPGVYTVQLKLKDCCETPDGEWCDCAGFAFHAASARPVSYRLSPAVERG